MGSASGKQPVAPTNVGAVPGAPPDGDKLVVRPAATTEKPTVSSSGRVSRPDNVSSASTAVESSAAEVHVDESFDNSSRRGHPPPTPKRGLGDGTRVRQHPSHRAVPQEVPARDLVHGNGLALHLDSENFQPAPQRRRVDGTGGSKVAGAGSTAPGTVVAPTKWKKGEMIGAGSYGRVYMGLNEDTGSLMAIKEIHISGENKQAIQQLREEISLLGRLSYKHIVRYLGAEYPTKEGMLAIFTEWVPGGSIASLLRKFGRLSESVCSKYTKQILLGLNYLHTNKVIHRDIKGANILVNDKGQIKLADFGASKRLSETGTLVDENRSLRGTPYFMAPEVIMQSGHGRKADIWSVGCTVLQMATGKPPWKSLKFTNMTALLYHICNTKEPPPFPDHVSDELRSLLRFCFQRDPKQRPSANELLKHPFVGATNGEVELSEERKATCIVQHDILSICAPVHIIQRSCIL